ncbi:MAG: amidohydrolase, partial [Azospira oryzae]
SDQAKEENAFQLQNAKEYDFIKGVVGWVDFQADDIEDQLTYYKQFDKMKGFRHILQSEPQRDYMLNPAFCSGIRLLEKHHFTYDLLILPDQLNAAQKFVSLFPDQLFVIDHLAKPLIKSKEINPWKKEIRSFSDQENVYCKLSGMITEANWNDWRAADIIPYIDVVVESFGTNRILFGSDWPVCLLAGSYQETLSLVTDYFSSFTRNEQDLFFGGNAIQFYNL